MTFFHQVKVRVVCKDAESIHNKFHSFPSLWAFYCSQVPSQKHGNLASLCASAFAVPNRDGNMTEMLLFLTASTFDMPPRGSFMNGLQSYRLSKHFGHRLILSYLCRQSSYPCAGLYIPYTMKATGKT